MNALLLVLLLPSVVRADAIMPFEGECPPGSERGISNHAEACIPKTCQTDSECGRGASCITLCTCRAQREFTSDGRILYPEPVQRVVEIGFCAPDGTCGEGEVGSRKQCEPDDETPAFDHASHRWTAEPHRSTGCVGCDAGGGETGIALVGLATLALLRGASNRARKRTQRAGVHRGR